MKSFLILVLIACVFIGCDDTRVFETNTDFEERAWPVNNKPVFEFDIADSAAAYNVYLTVRNSVDYPFSRFFVTYYLQDSANRTLNQKLVETTLFDAKTGEPFGSSGLGDIYDHRVALLNNHTFGYSGIHKIQLEQFMRTDTLEGILAVGVRVEKASNQNK